MGYKFNPFTGNLDLDPSSRLTAWLKGFRDSRRIYLSPDGNDLNDGTSLGEPLRTFGAAAALAQPGDLIEVGPGTYTEALLPIRWKRNVGILGRGLRNVIVRPAAGQEFSDIFHVDSGFWCWGLQFANHQADALTGRQSWAINFDALADNRDIGAVGLGAYVLQSPYIQNCSSITAEDDSGLAGSQSVGDTGGGILVDGKRCAVNSPIRSMVVDSYTQVNLGGPGCLVRNDGYAQLVSFFGTFCQYHVRTESGGQVNLSGGGTSDFGTYGLMADGYSPSPIFTGGARVATYGAQRKEASVTIDAATDLFTSTAHGLVAGDQVKFKVSTGTLPSPLDTTTTFFVISSGLTANAFRVSTSAGGASVDISGSTTGTYQFVKQGSTVIDVINFSANRIGRQIKYPSAGSAGSAGNPVAISSVSGSSFTVTLGTVSGILHAYVGGGMLTVGSNTYPISSCSYNNTTGVATLTASGYTPVQGASVTLSGLSFACNSASRPTAGQLMFPQLVFPRNATTGAAETKTFSYTRTGSNTLTFTEAASPAGPDHEYVSGGTIVVNSVDLGVVSAAYNKSTGVVTITTASPVPAASGSVTVGGLAFICPTSAYVVTSSVPINSSGIEVANDASNRAGYRVYFYNAVNGGLLNQIAANQILDFRNRSQISAPGHTFEYVGSGTNYDALPFNGGVPIPGNKIVETNNGRVYSSNTDELGNFAVGSQFTVDGTTGAVTITTDQFNLSGLNFIGPFSRNGGFSTVGVQLREVSNNTSLIASTGAPDANTAPTQFAVKEFTGSRFVTGVSSTAGQPLTITGSASADGNGDWTYVRNISLSLNQANGLARLDGSGQIPAAILPSYVDDVIEAANFAALPATGETGKIYVTINDGKTYRWSGSVYIEISNTGTDLGFTASSRQLTSSTGAGTTLPLFATNSANAGLVPGSSTGGTTNFLRADGTWAAPPGGSPGGSDTQIQFNDAGGFGGDADLTYNKTTNLLTTKGDINLDDGVGGFTTTLQCITPTANRTVSIPDATGTVALVAGSSGQLIWNNAGAYAGALNSTVDTSGNVTLGGRLSNTVAGAASLPPVSVTGTWFTGGTATTTKPQLLLEPSGTTSTAWSTSGTGLGVNAASGFAGNLLDLQVNGTSQFSISSVGAIKASANSGIDFGVTLQFAVNSGFTLKGNNGIRWTNSNSAQGTVDTILNRDGVAGTLAQYSGTTAQSFRVYNTFTSATNYERGKLEWSSNVFNIGTEKGSGGGTARAMELQTDGTTRLTVAADGSAITATSGTALVGNHRLTGTAPASATATGTAGDVRYDGSFIYVCTATNTWVRAALSSW